MLIPRLTTPSVALQNALSRVFRNALGAMIVLIESQSSSSGPDMENAVQSIDPGC